MICQGVWVRDLYGLLPTCEMSVFLKEVWRTMEREREIERGWMWHTGVLLCWQGLKSVVMIGEGNRIEEI